LNLNLQAKKGSTIVDIIITFTTTIVVESSNVGCIRVVLKSVFLTQFSPKYWFDDI
jgi:hypothetical protein